MNIIQVLNVATEKTASIHATLTIRHYVPSRQSARRNSTDITRTNTEPVANIITRVGMNALITTLHATMDSDTIMN